MLAILQGAVWCLRDNVWARNGKRKKLFDEVEEWILDESSDRVFSFESICEVLGFSPWYIRKGLLQWKEKKRLRHPADRGVSGNGESHDDYEERMVVVSFSIVPLLIAEDWLPPEARQALIENRLQDAADLLMQKYRLSWVEV